MLWDQMTTDERSEAIRREIDAGRSDLTTSRMIAAALGTTRNAIIGHSRRSGIRLPSAPTDGSRIAGQIAKAKKKARQPKAKPKPRPALTPQPTLEPLHQVDMTEFAVPYAETTSSHCAWPLWDKFGPDAMCCGAPRQKGQVYCSTHVMIAAGPGTERERSAHRIGRAE